MNLAWCEEKSPNNNNNNSKQSNSRKSARVSTQSVQQQCWWVVLLGTRVCRSNQVEKSKRHMKEEKLKKKLWDYNCETCWVMTVPSAAWMISFLKIFPFIMLQNEKEKTTLPFLSSNYTYTYNINWHNK